MGWGWGVGWWARVGWGGAVGGVGRGEFLSAIGVKRKKKRIATVCLCFGTGGVQHLAFW